MNAKQYEDEYNRQQAEIKRMKDMLKNNPTASLGMANAMIQGTNSKNNFITRAQENPSEYNIYAAGDLDNLNKQLLERIAADNGKFEIGDYDPTKNSVNISGKVVTGELNKSSNETANKILGNTGKGFANIAAGILHGSSDEAFNAFVGMIGENMKTVWEKTNEVFFFIETPSFYGCFNV